MGHTARPVSKHVSLRRYFPARLWNASRTLNIRVVSSLVFENSCAVWRSSYRIRELCIFTTFINPSALSRLHCSRTENEIFEQVTKQQVSESYLNVSSDCSHFVRSHSFAKQSTIRPWSDWTLSGTPNCEIQWRIIVSGINNLFYVQHFIPVQWTCSPLPLKYQHHPHLKTGCSSSFENSW